MGATWATGSRAKVTFAVMGEETNIEWAHCTGGPYLGCTEVSPGCAECYARELALARMGHIFRAAYKAAGFEDWETRPVWGKNAPRVLTKGFWHDAYRLNKQAEKADQRWRMFPSLIDWLDDMPAGIIDQEGNWLNKDIVLANFLGVIYDCKNLDWLLLTKRPEAFHARLFAAYQAMCDLNTVGNWNKEKEAWLADWIDGEAPPNVWLGASVEDRPRLHRIDKLRALPAVVRFLSLEPLLEDLGELDLRGIHWVIIGGESGPGARACNVNWISRAIPQCVRQEVKVFVKQLGSNVVALDYPLTHKKGGDPKEWDTELRIRQFPEVMDRVAA